MKGGKEAEREPEIAQPIPAAKIEPKPFGLLELEQNALEIILSYAENSPHVMVVCQKFKGIIGAWKEERLNKDYVKIKELGKKIYKQFGFVESWAIHRSSPLVKRLNVIDPEELEGRSYKEVTKSDVLESGRIISLRRQTQLSNMAEAWRMVGLDSEKAETFDLTFGHLWDSLNLKRWIGRDDIVWLNEESEDVSKIVNQLFDTLKNVREDLDEFQRLMKAIQWYILKKEHEAQVAADKKRKEEARDREKDEERKRKAGAFILDYRG
eukprot:CAMPEP_0197520294 /NCGR_PEP_ID=MMETSP1318-20131121/5624_1 /TAXON_ID=552666 /ORGANISM="Partenskyella glossopodia, Strain RCC365" /LENGTH=266 /DNA_ID=CAMNT_0043071773 /DNA_START=66 /DNA_END=866 /DNA_ORIENTATION=+